MIFITGAIITLELISVVRDHAHLLLTRIYTSSIFCLELFLPCCSFFLSCYFRFILNLRFSLVRSYNFKWLQIGVVICVKFGIKLKIKAEHIKVGVCVMINCPLIMTLITGRISLFLILTCFNNRR